jgi:hypothetical protein
MNKIKTLIGIALLVSLSSARAEEVSCLVPGFLNFHLQTSSDSAPVVKVNQFAYGYRYGSATKLAQALNVAIPTGQNVQSLVISQSLGRATVNFTFTNGSSTQVNLDKVQISLSNESSTQNGVTEQLETLIVSSSSAELMRIPAKANLCETHEETFKIQSIQSFQGVGGNPDCQSPPWPLCGHGSYAPPCCGN